MEIKVAPSFAPTASEKPTLPEVCSVRCWSQPAQVKHVNTCLAQPHPHHGCYCLLPKATSIGLRVCEHLVDPSLSERLQEVVATLPLVVKVFSSVGSSELPRLRGPEGPVIFYQSQQNGQSFFWDYRHNELIGSPNRQPSLQATMASVSRARRVRGVNRSVVPVLEIPRIAC